MSPGEIDHLREKFSQDIKKAQDSASLLKIHSEYLGKKGAISNLYRVLAELAPEERREQGAKINQFRDWITQALNEHRERISEQELSASLKEHAFDLTLPQPQLLYQGRHPITHTLEYLVDVLSDMGFDVGDGPEVEHEDFNFTYLNIPQHHPARATQDTFYVTRPYLLRTHTSPVQIHYMRKYHQLPIQMIAPGRVYRADDDATHSPMFHQIEGLLVDVGIHFGHLKGVITAFLKKVFESDKVRFRPSYFPFTEPSTEVDIGCVFCGGSGLSKEQRSKDQGPTSDRRCKVCKGTGWLEVMGAGLVHPQVLKYGQCARKTKSGTVSGLAFGLGIERIAMLTHRIPDMRMLFDNDPRILTAASRVRLLPLRRSQTKE